MRHKNIQSNPSGQGKADGLGDRGEIKPGGSAVGRGGSVGKGKADRPEGQSEGSQRAVRGLSGWRQEGSVEEGAGADEGYTIIWLSLRYSRGV